jgi:hypothetical protein
VRFARFAVPLLPAIVLTVSSGVSFPVAAQPAVIQCPALQMDNPNPCDTIMPGGYVVSGIAYDPAATLGSGVSHVDFFLGSRDDGGLYLGTVVPLANPNSFGPPRFLKQLTIPRMTNAGTEFVVYAFDAATNGQTSLSVPVRVGDVTPPTPAPASPPPGARLTSNCQAVPTAVLLAPPLPGEIAFTPTPPPQVLVVPQATPGGTLPNTGGPIFQLSNPNPDDVLPFGGYVVSGTAYDPASSQGPGVDRIQFFLDPRDQGGWLLGTATPQVLRDASVPTFSAKLVIPNSAPKGQHLLTGYAHSSVIGTELIISVPVFVGAPPTPTPLPA